MAIETSFPRGGKKEPIHKTAKVTKKTDYDLFGKKKRKNKKIDLRNEMGQVNVVEKDICSREIVKKSVDLPTYKSIREGMVLLGSIREIQKMALNILLPGRISGRVMITQISEPYTKLLKEIAENKNPEEFTSPKDLYQPGQHVAVKVVNINNEDSKCQIALSMDPRDVNSNLSFQNLIAGMLLWGTISSIEDHGFIIDLGIKNCRAFLPKTNTEPSKKYCKGQNLWCVLQKHIIDGAASTATLNVLQEKLDSTLIIKDVSLNFLLPGMHVDLTISKVLPNGLEGKFLNDFLGYVPESYLRDHFEKLERYKVGQIVQARILYIEPVTKISYLTLKKFNVIEIPDLAEGALVKGTVISISRGGIYVKINEKQKGFVSFKRLKMPLPFNADLEYQDLVRKHYKIGSQHSCRILNYDSMEDVYVCTMQKDLVNQSNFSYNDLKLGETTQVEVVDIQRNGLLVNFGRVTGFIHNDHLAETSMSSYDKLKNKYKVGQKLRAKIYSMNPNNSVLLTLKPTFMQTENNLTSYEMAEHNKQYPGTVVQITKNGLLVKFFGDVKGWVPKSQLSFEKVTNPEKMFKIDQIVNCTVLKCDNSSKLTLTLHPPKATSKKKSLKLGQCVSARIVEVMPNALKVEIVGTNVGAIIPSLYLTEHSTLAPMLLKTYKTNDVLHNLTCVNVGHGVPLLSLRDPDLQDNIKSFEDIQNDLVIPCSVHSITKEGLLLSYPVKNFEKLFFVSSNNVCEMTKKVHVLNLKKYQRIYAKVTGVKKINKHIFATTELSKVWNGDLNFSEKMLASYLSDYNKLRECLEKDDNPLCKFKMGQIVTGTVSKILKGNQIFVKIDKSEVMGKIQSQHATDGLKIGDEVTAKVLWVNFQQNVLDLTQNNLYKSRINPVQNGKVSLKVGKNVISDILLVKREFILVSLRGTGNRQLAYLPAQLHFNDLLPNTHIYKVGNEIKVQILQIDGNIIAISKGLKKNFENAIKITKKASTKRGIKTGAQSSSKRKREVSESDSKKLKIDNSPFAIKKSKMADTVIEKSDEDEENLSAEETEVEASKSEESDNESSDLEEQIDLTSSDEEGDQMEEAEDEENGSEEEDSEIEEINISDSDDDEGTKESQSKSKVANISWSDIAHGVAIGLQKYQDGDSEEDSFLEEDTSNQLTHVEKEKEATKEKEIPKVDEVHPIEKKKKSKRKGDLPTDDDTSSTKAVFKEEETQPPAKKKKKEAKKDEEPIKKLSSDEDTKLETKKKSTEKKKNKKSKKVATHEDSSSEDEQETKKKNKKLEGIAPVLSGVNSFWETPKQEKVLEESSDEEVDKSKEEELKKKQKNKKLTSAEKSELARQEEERLRKIELELADQEAAPKTADQFDRLVLANPNSSLLWINYIAFHLEGTEIEKARAIARKALKTIEFREEQEKLNVWIAFLNLENRYGTKESFSSILEEALKMNDSLTVHLQSLNILAESNKTSDFLELLNKVTKRYKQDTKMWIGSAEACYKCDQKEQARNLMQKAVKSLDEKQHVNLLVQFAFMESKWGETERAEAILEKILASYSKRVDIWCSYVDMLIKANRIHVARNVLERAVSQKMPPKKIKTLFTKFVQFEKTHGDEESVKKVRQLASDYVKEVLK